ncbi:acyltransferase [Flavobacterium oreochromis]|uniref:acyltransferase family protein n=1 Tax=Flavobacterium TaxID=237 RepID=UPI000A53108D|nr:acyltransferase [Flavobacterium covae]MCJ1809540.1 acyltransferase [Flavobacterium covae]
MRIEQLTFTRFIAAISIVIFHYGKNSYLFNNEYTSFIFKQTNVGVSYFFLLSGFVMIIAYGNRENVNFIEYIKNRLARIYPVYLLAIFLILDITLFQNINKFDLLLNLFMIQSWVPQKALTLNYPGWSLSVEMFFYISFPFLLNKIYSKKNLKINTISIISFWLISQIIFHLIVYKVLEVPNYSNRDLYYHPLMHFNEFLIGNLAGLFFINKLKNNQKNYFLSIAFFIVILILLLRFPIGFNFHNGLLAVIFVPLILLISLSNDLITKIFSKKIFIFLGEISFGIYILQAPVWVIFSDYRMFKYLGLNKEFDFTISFLIRLLILIIVSSLSYLYFEKPIRNLIKKLQLTAKVSLRAKHEQ